MISLAQVTSSRVAQQAVGDVRTKAQIPLAPVRVHLRVQLFVELEHFIGGQPVKRTELLSAKQVLFDPEESLEGIRLHLGVYGWFQGVELVEQKLLQKDLD